MSLHFGNQLGPRHRSGLVSVLSLISGIDLARVLSLEIGYDDILSGEMVEELLTAVMRETNEAVLVATPKDIGGTIALER